MKCLESVCLALNDNTTTLEGINIISRNIEKLKAIRDLSLFLGCNELGENKSKIISQGISQLA